MYGNRKTFPSPSASLLNVRRIGDYESDQFSDDRVKVPLAKFQDAIEEIESDLELE